MDIKSSDVVVGMKIIYHSDLYDKKNDKIYHGVIEKIDFRFQRVCIRLTEKMNNIIEEVNCSISNIDHDSPLKS